MIFSIAYFNATYSHAQNKGWRDVEGFEEETIFEAEDLQDSVPGVKVDTNIPHDLQIPDNRGRIRHFDELKGENGLVIYFLRSAVWCPYCVFQLRDIAERGSLLVDSGYNIVTVSYDSIRKLSIYAKENKFPYPMLSDKGSVVIQSFGLLNDEYEPGTTYYGVPFPAIYIVARDGRILQKLYEEDLRQQPNVSAVHNIVLQLGDYSPIVEYHKEFDR